MAQSASINERELTQASSINPAFRVWVPEFIATHGAKKAPGTARRMQIMWQALQRFLLSEDIIYPRAVRYTHGEAYLKWRMKNPVHGRAVKHNTALAELKFFSHLMNEAFRREYVSGNPLTRLGIARAAPKIKPELSDRDLRTLLGRSRTKPKWMERAIWISAYTGCRFGECQIESRHVDLNRDTLTIIDSKRDETDPRKMFTIPIPTEIRHIFEEMNLNNETSTCRLTPDKNGRINRFFQECGVNASFHSLRVTFVTRCHRAGLSMMEAMRLVNHSTQLVHQIYSRLNVEDARSARARVQLPTL